jgi:hypothetical protein
VTNALTQVRIALKAALDEIWGEADGTPLVYLTVTDADAPLVYVAPGNPYLSRSGANYGAETVRCNLVCVAEPGDNDVATEQLDAMVLAVIDAVDAMEDFWVDTDDTVDLPGQVQINGQIHLAVSVEVQTEIRRND